MSSRPAPEVLVFTVSVGGEMTAIIKIACGAASEEASCIPLPPRRRKLHIRWLLLPFQTVTAALGHSLGRFGEGKPDWANELLHDGGMVCTPGFAWLLFPFLHRARRFLSFSKEEKEKNRGEECGDQWSPLRCLFWCGEKSIGAGQREHRPLQAPLRRCAPAPPEGEPSRCGGDFSPQSCFA